MDPRYLLLSEEWIAGRKHPQQILYSARLEGPLRTEPPASRVLQGGGLIYVTKSFSICHSQQFTLRNPQKWHLNTVRTLRTLQRGIEFCFL